MIPDNGFFVKITGKGKKVYSKEQLLYKDFNYKIKEVLTYFHSRDFFKRYPEESQRIWTLKGLRDDIAHTKNLGNKFTYDEQIKRLIDFDYKKTLNVIAEFMNYYKKSDYVKECDCHDNF